MEESAQVAEEGYQFRYTDADVRNDPSLLHLAVAYAAGWTGDFEPLNRAKMEVGRTGTLEVRQARIVLNSMFNDYAWSGKMPHPERKVDVEGMKAAAKKAAASSAAPKQSIRATRSPVALVASCGNMSGHGRHPFFEPDGSGFRLCTGVPYEINRPHFLSTPAKFNFDLVLTETGSKVHAVNHDWNNKIWWHRNEIHSYGPRVVHNAELMIVCRRHTPITSFRTMDEAAFKRGAEMFSLFGELITACKRCSPAIEEVLR